MAVKKVYLMQYSHKSILDETVQLRRYFSSFKKAVKEARLRAERIKMDNPSERMVRNQDNFSIIGISPEFNGATGIFVYSEILE
jgi:hypothetical protein